MDAGFTEHDITLRDGRVVHVRTMRVQDEAELLQTFDRMSDDARYMRFMRVVREPNLERLRKALGSFPESGIGLVATVPAADGVDIVGSAISVIEGEGGSCEFAINVDSKFGGAGSRDRADEDPDRGSTQRLRPAGDGRLRAGRKRVDASAARRLGFSIVPDPEDRAVRICRLQLRRSTELGRGTRSHCRLR